MGLIAFILFVILYGVSIYTDLKWHKIKNFITIPIAVIALVLLIWNYGLKAGFFYVPIVLFSGLITEAFRIWGSGDTKLFIAASLVSTILLKVANPFFVLYFLGFNIIIYLAAGHLITFYKSGFKPVLYFTRLRMSREIGRMPGALPIFISNILAIVVFYGLG
jgi:Flp pilus assembly protein protease CpaA